MTPEERAQQVLKAEIKFRGKSSSSIGHFRRDFLTQVVEAAIRDAVSDVHKEYADILEKADTLSAWQLKYLESVPADKKRQGTGALKAYDTARAKVKA